MSELHVLMPDGEQAVYTEDQVNDLLEQGVITLENYYWQEGMDEWRPLLDLADAPAETPAEDIAEVPPTDSAEVLSEIPSAVPAETSFVAPVKTPAYIPSAARLEPPSPTFSETSSSVPSFVPPRRSIDPSLPVPQRPPIVKNALVKEGPESEKKSSISTPDEISPPGKDITEPKISDSLPAPSFPKKTLQPAPAAKQLEFTDAQPVVSPPKKVAEPVTAVKQQPPIVAEPAIRFEKIVSTPDAADLSPKNKYAFRKSPLVLTVGLQILLALSLLTIAAFLYQCYGQVYGGDDSAALLTGAGTPTGVSDSDIAYFLDFIWILVGAQIVIESLFICWVHQANFNCRGFISNMTYTPGWAVAYFFIPLINLFRPYQVIQEIWKVSENPQNWLTKRDSAFVGLWFLCRLAIIAIVIISFSSFPVAYSGSPDPHVRMLGTLCYLMVVEVIVFFIELTTLILVSVVTSRQVKLTKL